MAQIMCTITGYKFQEKCYWNVLCKSVNKHLEVHMYEELNLCAFMSFTLTSFKFNFQLPCTVTQDAE
jgi:hypothetical protein